MAPRFPDSAGQVVLRGRAQNRLALSWSLGNTLWNELAARRHSQSQERAQRSCANKGMQASLPPPILQAGESLRVHTIQYQYQPWAPFRARCAALVGFPIGGGAASLKPVLATRALRSAVAGEQQRATEVQKGFCAAFRLICLRITTERSGSLALAGIIQPQTCMARVR